MAQARALYLLIDPLLNCLLNLNQLKLGIQNVQLVFRVIFVSINAFFAVESILEDIGLMVFSNHLQYEDFA